MKNFFTLVLLCFWLSACITIPHKDITQVPRIEPSHVTIPPLMFLKTRMLSLEVEDQRSPAFKKNSEATTEELQTALTHILEASGIDVTDQAVAKLKLTFQEGPAEDKSPYCVQLKAHLQRTKNSYIEANSNSCYEKNGPLNLNKGGDVSYAYEKAIELLFNKINELGQQQ
jgi:hypothetical protein